MIAIITLIFSDFLDKSRENPCISSNFANVFRQALESHQDNAQTTDFISDLEQEILDDNLVIYAPYYDEFNWEETLPMKLIDMWFLTSLMGEKPTGFDAIEFI